VSKQSILITARRHPGFIELAVSDRGAGIAPEDRARITDRFVRLENSRSRPGSGLGLSLVAAVARLHGGVLRIGDNAPGLRAALELPPFKAAPLPAAEQVAPPLAEVSVS
jgi:signal transduction histidine kinase